MQQRLDPDAERLLLEKARKDLRAFQEIYQHYFPRVFAYVSYRVGRVHDAEDAVSATFLAVVQQLNQFEWRGEGSFAAWIFRLAHDRVIDHYRRNRAQPEICSLEELPDLRANTLLPDEIALQKEKFAFLRRLLERLSPRRREIITLKFFGGLRNNEIAEVLGLDERTIAAHLCRGLEDLHQRYVKTYGLVTREDSDERTE